MSWEYGQQIWDELMVHINNEYGVAGLMGNLLAESGLIPFRLQGDFTSGYTTSLQYTADVDTGDISETSFVNDSQGYGLAQWTFYTRKQALYNMKTTMNVSIGNLNLALSYLMYEMNNTYPTVLNVLINAISIREASDTVLHDFENPADQSEAVEIYRASLGQQIYDTYHNSNPPHPPVLTKKMPLWMMLRR
jgi:hypothetical protein